ncbi:MAG: nucleotide sugar dehydrogenase [Chitinophagales bacterium]
MTTAIQKGQVFTDLLQKKTSLALIGLGYVGLPIALEFAKKMSVIGFDINQERIKLMQEGIDPSNELSSKEFEDKDIEFTSKIEDLQKAKFYIVAVPTPIDEHKVPNLRPLLSASKFIGKVLKEGDYVIYESTVYPGCTEEDCVPILESISGLKCGRDFKVGYSPERINPGDKEHTITKITKVVSGCDKEALDTIAAVYGSIVTAGVFKASSIKVAEAAKVIENTQRDLNIALMNELSIIFDKMNISTSDVLEAAGTKWNFLPFSPGLVGGHCIGVDPYYLTYKSKELGYRPQIILSGRRINDDMGAYIVKRIVQMLIKQGKSVHQCKVLIMGVTFKENVSDIRNSKVIDLANELKSFSIQTDIIDPHASSEELHDEYGLSLTEEIGSNYDCVIVAVKHDDYANLEEGYFQSITTPNAILIDIKGAYHRKIKEMEYWTL